MVVYIVEVPAIAKDVIVQEQIVLTFKALQKNVK